MASKVLIDIIANDKASGVTSGITGSLGKLGAALAAIATAGAVAFIALGKQALDATAEYEKLTLTMETLVARELKAADSTLTMADALGQATPRAQELLKWIEKLAIQSPFDMEGVAVAFRTALAYGFTSDEAQRLTQNMIDFAAGTGQTTAVMNQAALALGQIRAKGKLAGQEILQLVNAGVPVNDILKEMGFTLDDVSAGLVSADAFLEAFNKTMEEDFGGAAARATNSWAGLLNSLGDIKKIGLRTLFADTFEVLQPLVATFAEWLQGEGLVKLEKMGEAMGKFTQNVIDALMGLKDLKDLDLVELSEAFRDMMDGVDWAAVSQDLIDGINSIDWAAAGAQVREASINVFEGLKIAAMEIDWSGIASAVGVGFADFWAAIAGAENWQEVIDTWESNFDQLKEITSNKMFQVGVAGKVAAAAAGTSTAASFGLALAAGGHQIAAAVSSWLPEIEGELIRIKEAFKAQFNQMMQAALSIILGAGMRLVAAVQSLMQMLQSAIKPIRISISLPNPDQLAQQVMAINAVLANLGGGGGGGGGIMGGKPTGAPKPNTAGGAGSGSHIGFARGGIATGSKQGYTATLHGTEAIIPLDGGNVPVQLLGGSGMTVNLTYAPMFSTVDAYELQERLAPFIERGIRDFQRGTA
jgi:tape measure domain-containing protein